MIFRVTRTSFILPLALGLAASGCSYAKPPAYYDRYGQSPQTSIRMQTEEGEYYFPSGNEWRRSPAIPHPPAVGPGFDHRPPPVTLRERTHRRDPPPPKSLYVPSGEWDGTRWKPNPTWGGRPDRFRP